MKRNREIGVGGVALSAILVAAVFGASPATAHCNGNHNGSYPHCSGEEPPPPPPPSSPSGCPGDFPAFAYALKKVDKRGRTIGSDLSLSNAAGTCHMMIHSESSTRWYDDLSFSFNADSGIYRIAYNYEWDESDTRDTGSRPNVRFVQFTVSVNQGIATIDDTLPLQAHKVYRYSGSSPTGRAILGTDLIGASLVFAENHGFDVGTEGGPKIEWYGSIKVIEDVSDCVANYGPNPDDNCTAVAFEQHVDLSVLYPKWALDTNRILFTYDPSSSRDSDVALGMIDRQSTGWSAPGLMLRHSELQYGDWDSTHNGFPAVWDDGSGSGPRTVVSPRFDRTLRILHLHDECTAATAIASSCLSQGLVTEIRRYDDTPPRYDHFTMNTTIDTGPNLIFFDHNTSSILEFDPDSGTEVVIIAHLSNFTSLAPVKSY